MAGAIAGVIVPVLIMVIELFDVDDGIAPPIGFTSAPMGIGGGTLSVPVMSMLSLPVHPAAGTALVFVNLPAVIVLFSMSVWTAPFGAKRARMLALQKLQRAFAVFLAISPVRMLWKAL